MSRRRNYSADDYAYDDDYDEEEYGGGSGIVPEDAPPGFVVDLDCVKKGSEVAARFSEDGCWYPALVDQVQEQGSIENARPTERGYRPASVICASHPLRCPGPPPCRRSSAARAARRPSTR